MTSPKKFPILRLAVILALALLASHSESAVVKRFNRLPVGQDLQSSVDLPPANQLNLCDLCDCTNLKAVCHFEHNKTLSSDWDSKYRVPANIKGIEVHLMRNIKFRLHAGFFKDNHINYIGFIGVIDNDSVELTPDAFSGNKAGYPEVYIFKISQVFLQNRALSDGEYKLLVQHIGELVVFPNAFAMTSLDATFRHIGNLKMHEKPFGYGGAQNGINLRIEDSRIDELHRFDASMNKVSLVRCIIGNIEGNAFDVTKIKELSYEHCTIGTIKSQALTGKLHSDNVSFVNTTIGTIEGEAINQSGITTLTLVGNTINYIQSGAIQATSVDTIFNNNTAPHTDPKWLNVEASQLEMVGNHFGHFSAFVVNGASQSSFNCSFANNQLDDPQPGSLNISRCSFHRNSVGRECACDDTSWPKTLTDHDLKSETLCQLKWEDRSCFANATAVDYLRFAHEACGGNGTRHCVAGEWKTQSASDQLSSNRSWSIRYIVIPVAGAVVTFAIAVTVWKYVSHRGGSGQARRKKCTFSEDNKHRLIELADKLEEHDQTRKAINKLVKGTFTENECLIRICDIVQNIPHKSSSIKDLLSNHLTECHESGTPMSPIGDGGGAYGMSPIGDGRSLEDHHISAPSAPPAHSQEAIYEELDQQNRPLMTIEYSELPLPAEDPYSEPFNATNPNDMPPAYQYATPMRHPRPPQPSSAETTACYATPVWRSTPSAIPTSRPPSGAGAGAGAAAGAGSSSATAAPPPRHVRDLRQDLEAMPQFHPNQLTSARNQRQLQQNYPHPQPQPQPLPQPHPQPHPPPYSQPGIRRQRSRQSFECLDGAASLAAMEHMDSGSDHSGGSDVTVQITDVIDYADA